MKRKAAAHVWHDTADSRTATVGADSAGTVRPLHGEQVFPGEHPAIASAHNELRIERLDARLAERGPLAVTAADVRRHGERVSLLLDGGDVLRLRLFWPRREVPVAVESIRWRQEVGWVVVVHTPHGRRVDYAWLASLEPTAPD